ncbi:MAG: Txe/YoeB family addiction module toxin [Synergistaceae bacterium]|nr:Txe/YoeB family addiction module toxin [Synergistaceae bacterium]
MYWQEHDKNILKKINKLVADIERHSNNGIGKPEQLKHYLTGLWSRRINGKHRLLYELDESQVTIYSCRYHYDE